MDGKTHQFGGLCAGVMVATCLFDEPLALETFTLGTCLLVGSSLGSLLPDIDKKNTKIRNAMNPFKKKRKPIKGLLARWSESRRREKERKREARKPEALKHRGITHSPFLAMVILLGLLLGYPILPLSLQPYYFVFSLGLFVGIVSHILMDGITKQGVPLLAPMTYKKYNILKLKLLTGRDEWIVTNLLLVLTTISVFLYFKQFI